MSDASHDLPGLFRRIFAHTRWRRTAIPPTQRYSQLHQSPHLENMPGLLYAAAIILPTDT